MEMEWLDGLDEAELLVFVPQSAVKYLDDSDTAAEKIRDDLTKKSVILKSGTRVAAKKAAIPRRKTPAVSPGPAPSYPNLWAAIKAEFRLLICTNNSKYTSVRRSLAKHGAKATTIIVSSISVAIASVLGVAAGMCVPFISLLLIVVAAVGKNAWCGVVPSSGATGSGS